MKDMKQFLYNIIGLMSIGFVMILLNHAIGNFPSVANAQTAIPHFRCSSPVVVGSSNDDWYIVGATSSESPVSIFFEPDIAGAGSTGAIAIQACMSYNVTASCRNLDYDSDQNGTFDTNVITGDTMGAAQVRGIRGIPYLRVTTSVNPGAEAARYVVCRGQE